MRRLGNMTNKIIRDKMWDWDKLKNTFGYNPSIATKNREILVDIWNIIGASYDIKTPHLILPDETIKKINKYLSSNDEKLSQPWDKYHITKGKRFYSCMSISDYNAKVKKEDEEYEKQKIIEEENEKKYKLILSKDLEILATLKKTYSSTWIDNKWINSVIGTYDNPFSEYYWTLITKDKYKKIDWKGNIQIREDVYKIIEKDKTFNTYSGQTFLSRSFKNKKGYSIYITGTYPYLTNDESGWGVYGIYYEDKEESELIYIGMTSRGFKTRWEEHYNIFKGIEKPEDSMILYKQNLDINKISFKKLINVKELKYEGVITSRDIEAMELALISLYKPKYNILGIQKPYIIK